MTLQQSILVFLTILFVPLFILFLKMPFYIEFIRQLLIALTIIGCFVGSLSFLLALKQKTINSTHSKNCFQKRSRKINPIK